MFLVDQKHINPSVPTDQICFFLCLKTNYSAHGLRKTFPMVWKLCQTKFTYYMTIFKAATSKVMFLFKPKIDDFSVENRKSGLMFLPITGSFVLVEYLLLNEDLQNIVRIRSGYNLVYLNRSAPVIGNTSFSPKKKQIYWAPTHMKIPGAHRFRIMDSRCEWYNIKLILLYLMTSWGLRRRFFAASYRPQRSETQCTAMKWATSTASPLSRAANHQY